MTRLLMTACAAAMLPLALLPSARAADALPPVARAPVVYLPPPPMWNGGYVGGNLGVGLFDPRISAEFAPFGTAGISTSNEAGVVGGVHGGYNWQVAPQWVVGVEGDFDLTSLRASASGSRFISASTNVNWLSSVRGRVGYLWTPGLMLYGTAGFAFADIDYQANLQGLGFIAGVNRSTTKDGFVVGAGAEYMWSREWLLRTEYLFYDFGSSTRSFALVPATVHWDNLGVSVLRLGASYKF
jgi:outer membrane immunogenic protein